MEQFDALQDSLGIDSSLARAYASRQEKKVDYPTIPTRTIHTPLIPPATPPPQVDYTQSPFFLTNYHLMEPASKPQGFTETLQCLPRGWRVRWVSCSSYFCFSFFFYPCSNYLTLGSWTLIASTTLPRSRYISYL